MYSYLCARRGGLSPLLVLVGVSMLCGLVGVALETARMQWPAGVEDASERLSATGFGGRNRGRYELGAFAGDYTRIESRWAILDPLYAANRGRSSFSLQGPGFEIPASADCELKQASVTVGVISFDPKKLSYHCTFAQGGERLDGHLVLGEKRPSTMRERLLDKADRHGEAVIDGIRITIRSAHSLQGTRLVAPTPIGYYLELDDRLLGGVELTDVNPSVYLPLAEMPDVRRAALLAAMALAVIRDPADSSLGE